MPDKWNQCNDKGCWRNKLKHANPIAKRFMKKNEIKHIDDDDYLYRNIDTPISTEKIEF